MQMSSFFTSHLLHTVVLKDQALSRADTAMLTKQLLAGIFTYITYTVKIY
jgi:hypothetical protein